MSGLSNTVQGTGGVIAARNRALQGPDGPSISDLVKGVGTNIANRDATLASPVGAGAAPPPFAGSPLISLPQANQVGGMVRQSLASPGTSGPTIADIIRQIRQFQGY